jgi:ABC-type branched-subunit amino acid transport system substrate-binding protein
MALALAAAVGLAAAVLVAAGASSQEDPVGGAEPPAQAGLTPQEKAGQQIYQSGTSPSGEEILAVLAGGTELPAAALPCAPCHADDGRGNPEGGVVPTDVTWDALTRPYGVEAQGGRQHGPYTESLLKRSIAMGLDPAGNELHVAMPRYRMSHEDMEALVAYMKQLGRGRRDWDPGIAPDRLRVGTLLPPAGRMEGVGGAIDGVLRAWAAELGEGGDLYGREVELVPFTLPADTAEWPAAVEEYLETEDVFALVGAYIAGGEAELTTLLRERKVPLVGPFTLLPKIERPVNPQVFYLLPGLAVQGRAMVRFALGRSLEDGEAGGEPPVAVVLHPEADPGLAEVAGEMVAEGRRRDWERLEARTYQAGALDALGLAAALATIDAQAVFFLGDATDRQLLLQGAAHYNWRPEVYTPGSMAGPEALATPPAFDGRLFLAFPTLPDDRNPESVAAYRALAEEHSLSDSHAAVQITTLAAARLFEEGVKRAGRDLTRTKLVSELESLYKWDSGLTPLLTFTPNRRIGAQGAHVVVLDLDGRSFARVGGWVEVE